MHNFKYKNYDEFKLRFKRDLMASANVKSLDSFLFRGQACSKWALVSSFDRLESDKSKYDALLLEFKGICSRHNFLEELFLQSEYDTNLLPAYAQHYGLPTRLVDWTKSYYMAVFFAYSEIVKSSTSSNSVSIWCINTKSEMERKSVGLEFVSLSTNKFNYRIKNQMGHFTRSLHTQDSIDEYEKAMLAKFSHDDLLWKFDIVYNQTSIEAVMADLRDMGISHSVVYPDLQGFIKEAVYKLKIGF